MIAADDPRHSTTAGYQAGCRQQCCRDANSAAKRSWAARAQSSLLPPNDPRHGNPSTYSNRGCRCERCTSAFAEHHRQYMNADPARLAAHAERQRRYYHSKRKGT